MRPFRIGICVLAVTTVGVGALAAPASARRRRPPTRNPALQIAPQAPVSSDGLTVDLKVTIRCKGFPPAPIRVSMHQNRTSGSGQSGTNYKCNGGAQQVVVPVTALSNQFRKGQASASASVTLRSPSSTSNHDVSSSVQLI
jgi:hypothetical protein